MSAKRVLATALAVALCSPAVLITVAAPAAANQLQCGTTYLYEPQVYVNERPALSETLVCQRSVSGSTSLWLGWSPGAMARVVLDVRQGGTSLVTSTCDVFGGSGVCATRSTIGVYTYYSELAAMTAWASGYYLGFNLPSSADMTLRLLPFGTRGGPIGAEYYAYFGQGNFGVAGFTG